MNEEATCNALWETNFRRAGFALEQGLHLQLPEYLRRRGEPFMADLKKEFGPEQNKVMRYLLTYRFPYPKFDVILDDIKLLGFGKFYLAWDENGKPIPVPRQ